MKHRNSQNRRQKKRPHFSSRAHRLPEKTPQRSDDRPKRGARPSEFVHQESEASLVFGGVRPLQEALAGNPGRISQIMATNDVANRLDIATLLQQAGDLGIYIKTTDRGTLDRLVGHDQHQGVACQVRSLPTIDFHQLLVAKSKRNLVALDQVQDPMNLGAVLRSANAFGVGAIICPKDNSAPLRHSAVKASAGAALHTPVVEVTNLARSLEELKEAGYWVVALVAPELEGAGDTSEMDLPVSAINHRTLKRQNEIVPLHDLRPHTPWVLVAGSEGRGIRPLVARSADFRTYIPMYGQVASLNVANATAVALYALSLLATSE